MSRPDAGGDSYKVSRATAAAPTASNVALSNQQIEAIFRPSGKSTPIDEYITQINTLSQKWQINAGALQQAVSDPATPTSMAGLVSDNTGTLKWTGAASSDFGTKAVATAKYGDQVAGVMPKIQTALGSLSEGLGKSKTAFGPIFDAWGSPGSGSKMIVPRAMEKLLQLTLPIMVTIGYDYKDQEQYNYFTATEGPMTLSAMVYVPAKNMHADPGNPYVASTFDVHAADQNGSGDYGYSGMVFASYNKSDRVQIMQKYLVWDSADGNTQVVDKDGANFKADYLQQHFPQQYNTHLVDLMTMTGQHFTTARSQFPPLPAPDKSLAPPANTTNNGGPSGAGGPGAGGLGGTPGFKGGTPTGIKQPTMPKQPTPTGITTPKPNTPPPYHLPVPTPPSSNLPGPTHPGGLPDPSGNLPGHSTTGGDLPGGLPTGGTPGGFTSTQTAGFDPSKMPTFSSGLGDIPTGLTGLGGPGGTPTGLGGLGPGGFGGGTPGGLGGLGPSGLSAVGPGVSAAEGAAAQAAARQAAMGEQAAMTEAGMAGRMPMMPPMAPMGMNGGNSDRSRKSWLPEEDDLWGLAEGSAAPPVIGSEF